ncbi:MAG: hypothetical protein K6U09_08025 [Acidobacteriia bacterium]|nr:hypothetical protein [Terriglobia bacterium]
MAWIRVVPPAAATGELAELYARVGGTSGSVDNILTVHSLNPASLRPNTLMAGAISSACARGVGLSDFHAPCGI